MSAYQNLMKLDFSRYMLNFMKIRPVGAQLFYTDGRTDGQTGEQTSLLRTQKKLKLRNYITAQVGLFQVHESVTSLKGARPTLGERVSVRLFSFCNKFILGIKLYMFRTVPLSIIRSFFAVHTAMVYVTQVCWQLASRIRTQHSSGLILLASCQQTCKTVWRIPLVCVQWKNSWWWTKELSETCRVLFQK